MPEADRNFKGPFYTLGHVRDRLKRDTRVLERGLGSVGGVAKPGACCQKIPDFDHKVISEAVQELRLVNRIVADSFGIRGVIFR